MRRKARRVLRLPNIRLELEAMYEQTCRVLRIA
jgi:hypothetical protein